MNVEQKIKSLGKVGYDEDSWGVGVSGVVSQPSPYPRINKLRDWWIDECPFTVDSQRALLVTEAYQKYENEPQQIKVAQAFANVLRNLNIQITEDQLLVGDMGAPPKSCAIYPEFSYDWIVNELTGNGVPVLRERPNNVYDYDDKTRDELLGIADYWKGKTVSDVFPERMGPDEMKGDFMGIMLYSTTLFYMGGIHHLIPGYQRFLDNGIAGMRQKVQAQLDALDSDDDKSTFYQAQLISLDALSVYVKRFASLARETAEQREGQRRDELLQMADNLELISEKPPETFWQAFQLCQLLQSTVLIESNGNAVGFGRLDQILYPYFRRDIDEGKYSRDFIQELIECLAIINTGFMKLRDWKTTQVNSGRGIGGGVITVGGVDAVGNDVTNELSGMFIDMVAHTRLGMPWIAVRFNKNTPDWFASKCVKAMRMGTGEPKLFSDEVIIDSMMYHGVSQEDARNYVICGCVEQTVAGRANGWCDAAYFSMARVLELAINDGYAIGHEDKGRLGPATGSLADFKSFDEVKRAYETQMKYWVDLQTRSLNIIDDAHRELKPLPYLSTLFDGCVEKGVDINAGGTVYNFTSPQGVGVGSVADAMAVMKQLVFEEQSVTGAEILDAIKSNWEGYDELYHLVNSDKVHQYGNDDDYVDELAVFAVDVYCDEVSSHSNPRGGKFQPGVYSVSANVPFGMVQAASPDGRKDFEPLSDCISPVHTYVASHDRKGPTAVTNSCGKLHQDRIGNGTLLNMRFSPPALSGETGVTNLIALIRGYFKKGQHIQLNVIGRELLEDAYKHPEKYRGLLVRVAGYSAPWAELSDELRLDILNRTELSFD